MIMTEEEILGLYSQWSEEYYCAGFLNPDEATVREFRKWLRTPKPLTWSRELRQDYEQEMLDEFYKQEGEL